MKFRAAMMIYYILQAFDLAVQIMTFGYIEPELWRKFGQPLIWKAL